MDIRQELKQLKRKIENLEQNVEKELRYTVRFNESDTFFHIKQGMITEFEDGLNNFFAAFFSSDGRADLDDYLELSQFIDERKKVYFKQTLNSTLGSMLSTFSSYNVEVEIRYNSSSTSILLLAQCCYVETICTFECEEEYV
jgi:hypothetical protein